MEDNEISKAGEHVKAVAGEFGAAQGAKERAQRIKARRAEEARYVAAFLSCFSSTLLRSSSPKLTPLSFVSLPSDVDQSLKSLPTRPSTAIPSPRTLHLLRHLSLPTPISRLLPLLPTHLSLPSQLLSLHSPLLFLKIMLSPILPPSPKSPRPNSSLLLLPLPPTRPLAPPSPPPSPLEPSSNPTPPLVLLTPRKARSPTSKERNPPRRSPNSSTLSSPLSSPLPFSDWDSDSASSSPPTSSNSAPLPLRLPRRNSSRGCRPQP